MFIEISGEKKRPDVCEQICFSSNLEVACSSTLFLFALSSSSVSDYKYLARIYTSVPVKTSSARVKTVLRLTKGRRLKCFDSVQSAGYYVDDLLSHKVKHSWNFFISRRMLAWRPSVYSAVNNVAFTVTTCNICTAAFGFLYKSPQTKNWAGFLLLKSCTCFLVTEGPPHDTESNCRVWATIIISGSRYLPSSYDICLGHISKYLFSLDTVSH